MKSTSHEQIKYLAVNMVKNIIRNRSRYLIAGILVYVIGISAFSALIISSPAKRLVEAFKPYYAPQGFYLPDEMTGGLGLPVTKADVIENEKLFFTCSSVTFATFIIGASLLLFVTAMLINERIHDTGILYSIGFSKTAIFRSMFFEILTFIFAVMIAGIITSAAAVYVMYRCGILPSVLGTYFGISGRLVLSVFIFSVFLILLPSLMLYQKIKKSSPLALLKEKN